MTNNAHNQLRQLLSALPAGINPPVRIGPPNRPLTVYSGIFRLTQRGKTLNLRGSIQFQWFPYAGIRFRGRPTGRVPAQFGPAVLKAPAAYINVPAQVTNVSLGSRPSVRGYVPGTLRTGRNTKIRGLLFSLPNFHDYVGDSIRFTAQGRPWMAAGRLDISAGPWNVKLDYDPTSTTLKDARTHGGFGVAHAGLLTRNDGRRFHVSEASDFYSCLHFFFSFCRGIWCGPILPKGLGNEKELWAEWSPSRVSTWKDVMSWFPKFEIDQIPLVFANFYTLWRKKDWTKPLSELVHWYVEANQNVAALEGSIVLAHTATDLLAWMYIVNEQHLVGARKFDKWTATARLKRLLTELAIPIGLPSELNNLKVWATREQILDGPSALSSLRNWIVHPTPKNRKKFQGATKMVRVDVVQLALWYLEMAMLAILGYRGKYVTRLKRDVTIGEATVAVPWP